MSSLRLRLVQDMMSEYHQRVVEVAFLECLESRNKRAEIWPASVGEELGEVELVVLPLERIGAPPGESGAKVFVAYLTDLRPIEIAVSASLPCTVKIGDHTAIETEVDVTSRWPRMDNINEIRFAKPLAFVNVSEKDSVLISPFRSILWNTKVGNETHSRYEVELNDLWKLLTKSDDPVSVDRTIEDALIHIDVLHRKRKKKPERGSVCYRNAFEWYLRNTWVNGGMAERQHIPERIFGSRNTVFAFGREWHNPRLVLEELLTKNEQIDVALGPVHGDLHPKNIVLDKQQVPYIIDFGWSHNKAPLVVDYILLDINLRSITLPSQFDESSMLELAEFLDFEREISMDDCVLRSRARIIKKRIWSAARVHVRDWISEYVVPFFVIGYGLLVHLDNARNQAALVASVLAAGDYIRREGRKKS